MPSGNLSCCVMTEPNLCTIHESTCMGPGKEGRKPRRCGEDGRSEEGNRDSQSLVSDIYILIKSKRNGKIEEMVTTVLLVVL